jgi:hypothetical protein
MQSKSMRRVLFAVGLLAFVAQQSAAEQMSRHERIERALNDLGKKTAAPQAERSRALGSKALCFTTDTNLCLLGRFVVVAVWDNPYSDPNAVFTAGAIQLTSESGYMWFDSPTNMEIPLKLLNFCQEGTFKVFAAGLSDFGVNIGIIDQVSGTQVNYINDDKNTFNTIIDESPPWPCL